MAGCGRSSAVRIAVAAPAAALALWVSGVGAVAGSPIQLTAQVGYHSSVKLGNWIPVAVDITNRGGQFDGTLEVDAANTGGGFKGATPPGGTAVYETPVSLPAGATKHFRTYVSEDQPGNIDVRLVQGGRVVAADQVAVSNTVSGLMVGVLSDNPSALDTIATVHPGGVAPTVIHLTAGELADSALILRSFDIIALDDFSSDTLTSGQRSALGDYVTQGGALLIGTGGSWRKTLAALPAGLVPMKVTGTSVLPASGALGGVTALEVATGIVSGGANAWLTEGGTPLLVEGFVGSGIVNMSTFDWAQGPIIASDAANAVLREAVVRSTYGNPNSQATTGLTVSKGGIMNSVAARGGTLSQALGNVPALDLPAWWLIGGLVFIYVLVVGPLNYFVLRAAGRRALAWVTVPLIALIASGGAYGASVLTKGTSVVANEVAIVHVQQGWDRAYSEQYTGIVAPTRGDYEVALGPRAPMVSPIYYEINTGGDPNLGALRVDTSTGGVTLPSMSAFVLRGFASEGVAAAPAVTASVQLAGGKLTGTIKNSSTLTYTDGVVLAGNAYQAIGRLAPGQTANFNFAPSITPSSGNPTFAQIYPNAMCCGGPPMGNPDLERRNEARTAVLSTLTNNIFVNNAVSATPVVVLWTTTPVDPVTVNGAQPRTYVETAVALTLPVVPVAAGALPAGFAPGRIVDLDASLSPAGPPGLVMASSGSLTYSFRPDLVAGSHLHAVSVASFNPYGGKFAPGNGTSGTVKGQVWDWAASAWTDVRYSDSSPTTLPDSAVNPTTGEVLMRIQSDGQFTAGYTSLAGTVS